jgi:hypothetical protein
MLFDFNIEYQWCSPASFVAAGAVTAGLGF